MEQKKKASEGLGPAFTPNNMNAELLAYFRELAENVGFEKVSKFGAECYIIPVDFILGLEYDFPLLVSFQRAIAEYMQKYGKRGVDFMAISI